MRHDFQADIDAIERIDAIPTILDVVCRITGMRFAAVARVTDGRWITCKALDQIDFGLKPGDELPVETTICHEIRQSGEPVVIDHVTDDEAFRGHPTPAMYGFQSYISMPIVRRDGAFFGTLCAIDPKPAQLKNPATIGMFKLFAELIASHLDAGQELENARTALRRERELSELREQFIAVLGHDLRNPVGSIEAGTNVLLRSDLDEKSRGVVALMRGSVFRIRGLIDNVMDFARARLGDGLELQVDLDRPLEPVLEQVVAEIRTIDPDRRIETDFSVTAPVPCDHARISQMFSNLLGNAISHGSAERPVVAGAATRDGHFELWVANSGKPIPDEVLEGLFQPFFRAKVRESREGLGLGLYIASEIARVHGGTLEARSDETETRFTFRMPLA